MEFLISVIAFIGTLIGVNLLNNVLPEMWQSGIYSFIVWVVVFVVLSVLISLVFPNSQLRKALVK